MLRIAGIGLLSLAFAAGASATLHAEEADYIGLFAGHWSGTGTVLNNEKPLQVSCRAFGQPDANHLVITGTCNLFLVAVPIAADVTFDPTSGRYSGTYTGGNLSAQIDGRRKGSTVDFAMTWS